MFHFTDIVCCSRTDFERSYCKSLLPLILKPIQEQEKKGGGGEPKPLTKNPQPNQSVTSQRKEGRIGDET